MRIPEAYAEENGLLAPSVTEPKAKAVKEAKPTKKPAAKVVASEVIVEEVIVEEVIVEEVKAEDNAPAIVHNVELVSATETTITKAELDKVAKRIEELERNQVAGRIGYYIDLGREWAGVYKQMKAVEFNAWLNRLDRTRGTVMRNMKLAAVVDSYADGFKETLLNAPKLTLEKLEIALTIAGPEKLIEVVTAETHDNRGATCLLSQLPVKQLAAAAKSYINKDDAKEQIDSFLEKAEQLDAERKLGASVDVAPADVAPADVKAKPVVAALPAQVAPLYPMPHLVTLSGLEKLWAANRQKIADGNIAALSAKEIMLLESYSNFLTNVLVPDLNAMLATLAAPLKN